MNALITLFLNNYLIKSTSVSVKHLHLFCLETRGMDVQYDLHKNKALSNCDCLCWSCLIHDVMAEMGFVAISLPLVRYQNLVVEIYIVIIIGINAGRYL